MAYGPQLGKEQVDYIYDVPGGAVVFQAGIGQQNRTYVSYQAGGGIGQAVVHPADQTIPHAVLMPQAALQTSHGTQLVPLGHPADHVTTDPTSHVNDGDDVVAGMFSTTNVGDGEATTPRRNRGQGRVTSQTNAGGDAAPSSSSTTMLLLAGLAALAFMG